MTDEITYRLDDAVVPLMGDVFTQEALDGLIGQTPRLTVGFDQSDSLGRVTITHASQVGGSLRLGMTVDRGTLDRIEKRMGRPEEYSLGFIPTVAGVDPGEGKRTYVSAEAKAIAAGMAQQFYPQPATPKDAE